MYPEEQNKKNNIVIILVLVVIVLGLGSYLVYDKVINKDEKKSNTEKIEDDNDKEEAKEQDSKIDKTKELVYDATYVANATKESYITYSEEHSVKNIVVPYINIDSNYAKEVNNEIKSIFESAIERHNNYYERIKDLTFDPPEEIISKKIIEYNKYIDDNTLSIVIIDSHDPLDVNYYTYNFNLETGEKLSFEEVYKLVGFTSDNITESVEKAITLEVKEEFKKFDEREDFNLHNNKSLANYRKTASNGTTQYFLNSDKKLTVIVSLSFPAERDFYNWKILVE